MLILYNSNQDNRRMIQELITHIIDNCAPLIDINVCCTNHKNYSQNSNQTLALSAGSLLYSIVPLTRQHLPIDQMNSIKHLIHRIITWNVLSNSKPNFQVNFIRKIYLKINLYF
jgi:hypothetical protein